MKRSNSQLLALLCACFSIIWLVLISILEFNGLYGQDSYEYLRISGYLAEYGLSGSESRWPLLYPLTGMILNSILGNAAFSLQATSLVGIILLTIFFYKCIRLLFPEDNRATYTLIVCFLLFSPMIFRASLLVMSDILATGILTAGVYYAIRFGNLKKPADFIWMTLFLGLAIATRFSTIIIVATLFLYAFSHLRYVRKKNIILLLLSPIAIAPLIWVLGNFSNPVLGNHLSAWSPEHMIMWSFDSSNGLDEYRTINLVAAAYSFLHPSFIFAGLIFLLFLKKSHFRNKATMLLVVTVILYILFISGFDQQNKRHLIVIYPLILLVYYKPFSSLMQRIPRGITFGLVGVVVMAIQILLIIRETRPIYRMNQLEKKIVNVIESHPSKTIYTFGIDGAVRTYGSEYHVINLWDSTLDTVLPGSLVLFNESRFSKRWHGKTPMNNWNYIKSASNLILLDSLDQGWILYETR